MIKIRNIDEFNNYISENSIPQSVAGAIMGDLLVFEKLLDESFYDKAMVDLYGPMVVIVDENEFKHIDDKISTIEIDEYEYKEIVAINQEHYISKVCYLFNNGESGIIVYIMRKFNEKKMFDKNIYITSHAASVIPEKLLNFFKSMIDSSRKELNGVLDYLQVFEVKNIGEDGVNLLAVEHRQEEPNYNRIYYIPDIKCEDCKVFWISEEDENGFEHSTIMLAEDY